MRGGIKQAESALSLGFAFFAEALRFAADFSPGMS
jgi:hypothetical protein